MFNKSKITTKFYQLYATKKCINSSNNEKTQCENRVALSKVKNSNPIFKKNLKLSNRQHDIIVNKLLEFKRINAENKVILLKNSELNSKITGDANVSYKMAGLFLLSLFFNFVLLTTIIYD